MEEAQLWQSLSPHPHIIAAMGSLEISGYFVILLELASGGDLFGRIQSSDVTEHDACRWAQQILLALDFLHTQHGMIHRDVKPENLLLASPAPDAPLRLTDFGTAKRLVDPARGARTPIGSMAYAAPEQVLYLRGEMAVRYGRAADIWAAGVTVYVVLSGTLPFNPRGMRWVRTVPDRIEAGAGAAAPYAPCAAARTRAACHVLPRAGPRGPRLCTHPLRAFG